MPTTPYAKIVVSVNSGGPQSGVVPVSPGDVVQLSGESTVGWPGSPAPKWEAYDAPVAASTPAGWSVDGNGVFFYLGVTPPALTMPTIDKWGKWMLRLTVVVGGLTLVDEATFLSMLSAGGLADIGFNESTQGGAKSWTKDQKANLRVLAGAAVATLLRVNHASSATVLATGQVAMVDVSGGAPPSITMPPSPADGAICSVVNAAGSFATTPCPVTANTGQAIEDPNTPGTFSSTAGSVSLSAAGAAVDWMWDATNSRWKIR